jgi:Spy/CpxP family protein refolding chaperone
MIASLLVASGTSAAPMPPPPPMPPGPDPIAQHLFPPDFVVAHADVIGLTQSQRTAIESAAVSAMTQSVKLQFRIQDSMSVLGSLLAQPRIEEARVMTQLDQELDLERQMKRAQLGLMIQIKNILTPEQQSKLQRLRTEPGGP